MDFVVIKGEHDLQHRIDDLNLTERKQVLDAIDIIGKINKTIGLAMAMFVVGIILVAVALIIPFIIWGNQIYLEPFGLWLSFLLGCVWLTGLYFAGLEPKLQIENVNRLRTLMSDTPHIGNLLDAYMSMNPKFCTLFCNYGAAKFQERPTTAT